MAGYLGAIPVPQATQHRETFSATSGQTTFNTAGYTVGFLDVYLNGSHLSPADFTATNGSDVVLASGASADDVCDIISYTAFEVADQTFTGTTTMDVAAITGVLTTTAATVFNGGFASNANSTIGGKLETSANNNGGAKANYVRITDTDTTATAGNQQGGIEFYTNDVTPGIAASIEVVYAGSGGGGEITFNTNASSSGTLLEAVRIDENGSVGIGTNAPYDFGINSKDLTLNGVKGGAVVFTRGTNSGTKQWAIRTSDDEALRFEYGSSLGSEALRLDSSGNLLVGKTVQSIGTVGVTVVSGQVTATADGADALRLNRLSSYGSILDIRQGDTTRGSIGVTSDIVQYSGTVKASFGAGDVGLFANSDNDALYPVVQTTLAGRDNAIDLGISGNRFDDIYATNGTIQTSDRNEKQDIAALTATEMLVGKRISALFKTFRWKDKVSAKGNDARTHTGIIAQDVQAAFTAEGLDAGDYSLFISSTWWEHDVEVPAVEAVAEVTEDVVIAAVEEELDEEGNVLVEAQEERTEQRVITEAVEAKDAYTRTDTYDTQSEAPEGATSKTRMGIRYPELLSFVAAYNEQRFASIETRLTALEG